MSDYPLAKYSAKIKDVYIELKNYQFFHSPYDSSAAKHRFIGREKIKSRIVSILDNTKIKSGSYLITGFRGMGKTSVVREALDVFNDKQTIKKENNFSRSLDDLISEFMKIIRIFVCCVFTYFLFRFISSDYLLFNLSNFITFSYVAFVILFLVIKRQSIWQLNNSSKSPKKENPDTSGTNLTKVKSTFSERINRNIFGIFLLINLITVAFLFYKLFDINTKIKYQTAIPTFLLLTFFLIIANFITKSNEIFEAFWNYFRILIVVFSFALLTLFFFNYRYVCQQGGFCNSDIRIMDNYFPTLSFQKKSVSDPNNADKTYNESSPAEVKETNPTTDADALTVIFRIIVSLLLTYIVFLTILFFIDWFYSIRIYLLRPKTETEANKYRSFEINLSQDGLDEMEILRRMTIEIETYWQKRKFELGSSLFNRKIYYPWQFFVRKVDRPRKNQFEPTFRSVSGKLNLLKNRMSGNLTTRRERKTPTNITTPIAGLVEFSMPLGSHTSNDEIAYQIASVKEAEDQLREILNDIDELRSSENKLNIPQFVFIIDELDKIDPHNSSVVQERESSDPVFDSNIYAEDTNRFRQRREAVGRLLANLKGFLNVAKAKFFFIGGREMFDADLADIADRESFYSSVFNDVIYVDSFYKDSIGKNGQNAGGITQMTETYICNIILNELGETKNNKTPNPNNNSPTIQPDKLNLKTLYKWLPRKSDNQWLQFTAPEAPSNSSLNEMQDKDSIKIDELNRQKYKIISTLQNYIIYLTYRSSGTPKKLTGLIEHLIVKGPKFNADFEAESDRFFDENVVVLHSPPDPKKSNDLSDRLFLKFGFNTQYELGLTANLYRPYLIANSRHLKSLGDKLLYSSSFIIDHILKFHPFGFSWRNLELIPEVVLVNREPNLREFIEELMRFYSINYIRDTVSGIFDYRFRGIIRRELIHLSKTSDLSAAAFNFTLDESLATKRYYKRKFYELHAKYNGYTASEGDNQFIHSIYFVQTILGDLHFYDKEYDEAILYYTESIQTLRLPNAITDRKITRHQFLLWVKNKLKLGLTLEKIRAFDSAFSIYKTLILDSDRYFKHIVSKEDKGNENEYSYDKKINGYKKEVSSLDSEDHRSIHLICMPFVALLAVTEKLRNDGITYTNLFSNRRDFLKTINVTDANLEISIEKDKVFDKYRKYYLLADYYNNIGSILYYKNCQFTRFFKEPTYFLEVFDGKNENYSLIRQQNTIYDTEETPYDFFPSLTSFNYYWNALYFLLKYHQDRIEDKIRQKIRNINDNALPLKENLLAICTGYLLPECVDMVSSNRLYYIANVISKIGDSILSSLDESKFTIPDNEFNALDISGWEKGTDKNRDINISWFIDNLGENLFSAETVLYTYKLAAALYKRAGYNSYYASHLTRILYVIKDLIELNKNKEDQRNKVKNFLGIDENEPFAKLEEIAETIFKATTWNNEVSNRPQILKYREIFNISIKGNKDRELIYNIINNISDSKEVIVLVESIKIKLSNLNRLLEDKFIKQDKFIEEYFTLSKTITSAYGTMSNRYQRMLELKYRTERCFYIINDVLKLGALFRKDLLFSNTGDEEKLTFTNGDKKINETIIKNIKEIIKERTQGKVTINDVVTFMIHEALFSSSQLIKMIKLYNPGYVIGYSFIAEAHNRMGAWCQAYDNYLTIINENMFGAENILYDNHLKFLEDTEQALRKTSLTQNKTLAEILSFIEDLKLNKDKVNAVLSLKIEIEKIRKYLEREGKLNLLKKVIQNLYIFELEKELGINQASYAYQIIKDWIEKSIGEYPAKSITINVNFFEENLKKLIHILKKIKKWKNKKSVTKKFSTVNITEEKKQLSSENKEEIIVEIHKKVCEKFTKYFYRKLSYANNYTFKTIHIWINKNSKIENLKKDKKSFLKTKFDERIKELLGEEGKIYLESKNHYEIAVQYYYKMIQLHSDGKTYKDKLHEIYMLEDDYNDNMAHYTIAAERVRINTGKIKKKINYLNDKIKDSKVYKYNSYLISDDKIIDGLDIETINKYLDYFSEVIIGDTQAQMSEV